MEVQHVQLDSWMITVSMRVLDTKVASRLCLAKSALVCNSYPPNDLCSGVALVHFCHGAGKESRCNEL